MRHLTPYPLYESESALIDMGLLPKTTREEYTRDLVKLVSFPELYKLDFEGWNCLLHGYHPDTWLHPRDLEEAKRLENLTKYFERYERIYGSGSPQEQINLFLLNIVGGFFGDEDFAFDDWGPEISLEQYKRKFAQPTEMAIKMKCLKDNVLYALIGWVKIK